MEREKNEFIKNTPHCRCADSESNQSKKAAHHGVRNENVKNFITFLLILECESYIIAVEGRDDHAI